MVTFIPASRFHSVLVTFIALSLSVSSGATGDSGKTAKLHGGYYLLHKLCDEESQVSILTTIKSTPPEIAKFSSRISKEAKQSEEALEHFRDKDSRITFDENPLPVIEQEVRKSISGQKEHQLLFGTTNSAFVQAFLVSQIESSSYALNLAKVLGEEETDATRIKALRSIQAKWQSILDEAYRLLQTTAS